jgi:hypothetical protein
VLPEFLLGTRGLSIRKEFYMVRWRHNFALAAFAAFVALPATLFAQPTLVPYAHYRLGEEDPGTPTPGEAPETGLSYDEIKYAGIERDLMVSEGAVYSDFVPPGGYSTLSMKFNGETDLFTTATQWHGQAPNSFRIGMEAWVWIDPVMQGTEFVPFANGSGMGFIGTASGKWTVYGTGGFPETGEIKYGEWQHIAFNTNGSQWNFYLDGEQTVFAHGGTYGATSGDLTIGGDRDLARRMVGYVDEARLFRWGNNLPNQLQLQVDELLVFAGLTKGDVTGDGIVDIADYDVWRANVGADMSELSPRESLPFGDVNHDKLIDLDDFALIKASQTPGATPVPEPATWALAGIAACVFAGRRVLSRKSRVAALTAAALVGVLGASSVSQAQLVAQWDGTDGNWTDPKWTGGSGPNGEPTSLDTAEFLEFGTATINTNVGSYAKLVTRKGGTINIAPAGVVSFDNIELGATGGLGNGTINVEGSLTVPVNLSLALGDGGNGNATSSLNVLGAGRLRTPVVDAFWANPGARFSVTGGDTDVEVGDFLLGVSTLVANITGVAHAPIKATSSFDIFAEGSAAPGSALEVHFDLGDSAPVFGHSWTLVDTPVFTNAPVGVTSGATFKSENVEIGFLDVPGLRAELKYKAGGTLGQTLTVDVVNNLNLKVDTGTGAATLENPTVGGAAFDIDGIMITSASGSLVAGGYDGIGAAGWAAGLNQSDAVLSESNILGSTSIATGATFDLGDIFSVGGDEDLVFEFHVAGGGTIRGTVEYVDSPTGQPGDTNNDGLVNLDDLNAVRNNFGAAGEPGSTPGDAFPFDGEVDLDDLNAVRNNFGAGPTPVPEPSTIVLAIGLGLGLAVAVKRKR